MRTNKYNWIRYTSLAATGLAITLAIGCSDDSSNNNSSDGSGSGSSSSLAGAPGTGGNGGGTGGNGGGTGGTGEGASLPTVLSFAGCEDVGLGSLCSLSEDDGALTANCGGVILTGAIDEDDKVTLAAADSTDEAGATTSISCSGKLVFGKLQLDCSQSVTPTEGEATTATCKLNSDPTILAGVTCMELPATLDDVVLCSEGAEAEGQTIEAGDCKVIQDGCVFQAECADDVTLSGTVSRTGVSFRQDLVALADAAVREEGDTPAFLKGETASHSCTGALDGGTLTGSCSAGGAGRGSSPTSVCSVAGGYAEGASCEQLVPGSNEHLFVLDACDVLKLGGEDVAGIGEPVCALRQNNCIWEIQCGSTTTGLVFSDRLEAGATKAEWTLPTGTPCEVSFDAEGNATGKCTVPGQAACELKSKDAVPGGDECPTLPAGVDFSSRGCAGGDPLDCRALVQHGCDFMTACAFSSRFPDLLFAGTASYDGEQGQLDFNGIGNRQCSVVEASANDVANDNRQENEWYGQCLTPEGSGCRDDYNATSNPGGFRGLQLFFGSNE